MSVALLAVTLAVGSFSEERANLEETQAMRSARLIDAGLESSARPSQSPILRMLDSTFLGQTALPRLDDGGGMDSGMRQVLALVLGFIPGFGLGHLIARDRNGFVLFLVIDLVLYSAGIVGGSLLGGGGLFIGLGSLVWLVVHIFQAFDAYARAGGERIIERTRERAVMYASRPAEPFDPIAVTTRLFRFSF